MATGLFQSGQNGAPEKPFINNMNYNTIQGLMTVEGKEPIGVPAGVLAPPSAGNAGSTPGTT